MPYNTDRSGSTLSDQEMAEEAERILQRLRGRDLTSQTAQARAFVESQMNNLDFAGGVVVTVKQLWWLRAISEAVD